jgi:hypothetical protein
MKRRRMLDSLPAFSKRRSDISVDYRGDSRLENDKLCGKNIQFSRELVQSWNAPVSLGEMNNGLRWLIRKY